MRLRYVAGTAAWIATEFLSQSRPAEQRAKGVEASVPGQAVVRFRDDFERDLSGWRIAGLRGVSIQRSPDADRGRVLVLTPHGDVHVLVEGSEGWAGGKRIEGEVMFPTSVDSYLGVIYNFQQRGARTDFGLVYIKGDDSYLQANPHRDYNVSRTFYPEYRASLSGNAAVQIGRWQRFKVETVGDTCHFYVGDMDVPQMTFALSGQSTGAVGLQPRSVGGEVWVDNVVVSSIPRLSYRGAPRPELKLERDSLLTSWSVLGPLERTRDEIARRPAAAHGWQPYPADARGGIATGRVVDYHGPRTVAYFRTQIRSDVAGEGFLALSTVDDLALWVNGRFHWFVPAGSAAWYDVASNAGRQVQRIPFDLVAGVNELVIRVRGGRYASGGYFAHLIRPGARP